MKLYFFPPSTNCIKIAALLHHGGIQPEIIPIDLTKGEARGEEYRAINPDGKVPFLTDGDFKLSESNAILMYIAEKNGCKDVWPDDAQARADIARWLFWDQSSWVSGVAPFVWENVAKGLFGLGAPDEAVLKIAGERLERAATLLDNHLAEKKFVTGDQFTIADFALGCYLVYAEMAKIPVSGYANIQAWFQRLNGLECWQKAMPQAPASA